MLNMKICGLQKVSTIDYLGEICCVIFLKGCNFRCGFCHNPSLVIWGDGEEFSEEYVLDFLKSRVGKLDAVCISGGEPLMSLDFDFVRSIKDMGYKIKIDTNGSFPARLKEMIDLGLVDYVAMDVKSCREDYSLVVNADVDLGAIEESMRIVYDFGMRKRNTDDTDGHGFGGGGKGEGKVYTRTSADFRGLGRSEFRTTVVGRLHSVDSIVSMGKWVSGVCGGKGGRFFLQGFKSGKEMVDSSFGNEVSVKEEFLLELKGLVGEYFGEVDIRV